MGPAGAGKSTVGRAAAALARVPFYEGDDFHPPENIAKIRTGMGLSPADRAPWILAIAGAIARERPCRAVLACSALNADIRRMLTEHVAGDLRFVLLEVPRQELLRRLRERRGHVAGPALLESQLAAMDEAPGVARVDGTLPVDTAARHCAALIPDTIP